MAGTIRLKRASIAAADTPGAVAIVVGDDGPGIPEDLAPHVFDRFTKSADVARLGPGARHRAAIVAAHGGSITLLANDGIGTRIEITLPVDPE